MEYLKDLYYKTLINHAQMFDLDLEEKFPRHLFEKEFKDCLDYGLMVASYVLPVILTDDPELFRSDTSFKGARVNQVFNNRINEILDEYIEWGIL